MLHLTTPAEYPCGRTALADVSGTSMRSLHGQGNSSLHDNITSVNSSYSTTPLPSTSTATTPLPSTSTAKTTTATTAVPPTVKNESAESNLVFEEVVSGPVKTPLNQLTRIVGGEVVIPGEIPWQVFKVGVMDTESERKRPSGSSHLLSPSRHPGSLGEAVQWRDILRRFHPQRALGHHRRSLPGGGARLLLHQSG